MYQDGDVCLYFLPDTQIEDWFLRENKLYRKNPENPTERWSGFFEENRRVKILKIRGEYSQGFIFNLGPDDYSLDDGDLIEELYGKPLCQRWESPSEIREAQKEQKDRQTVSKYNKFAFIRRLFAPRFERNSITEHIDTPQLVHVVRTYCPGDTITITEKYHGTSGRTGKLATSLSVTMFDKRYWEDKRFTGWRKEIPVVIEQTGTRRTIVYDSYKGIGLGSDNYRVKIHHELINSLKVGQTIYYEIVGYEPSGKLIMPSHGEYRYSYGCKEGDYRIIIYRMTETNDRGIKREFSHNELQEFCYYNRLPVAEPIAKFVYDGDVKQITDFVVKYCEMNPYHFEGLLEGLVVRNDNPVFCKFAKFKSNLFSEAEGISKQSEKIEEL